MKYSIIIPCFNNFALLSECFSSVLSSTGPDTEIVLVNNLAPYTDVQDFLSHVSHPRVRVLNPGENLGSLGAGQYGKERARGEFLVYLDDDVEVPENGWLEAMEQALMDHPDLGMVSLFFEPGSPELGRGEIRTGESYELDVRDEPIFVMCAMTERSVWQQCFSNMKGCEVFDCLGTIYYQGLQRCQKKVAYVTSHYVKFLACKESSGPLYKMWKVLYEKKETEMPYEKWCKRGHFCYQKKLRLLAFGSTEEELPDPQGP